MCLEGADWGRLVGGSGARGRILQPRIQLQKRRRGEGENEGGSTQSLVVLRDTGTDTRHKS